MSCQDFSWILSNLDFRKIGLEELTGMETISQREANKNYSMVVKTFVIWPFTQMKLDAADVFCGQIIAAITVSE